MVFVLAFALGMLRVLVVAPRLGEAAAVLLEVPVVLAVSWGVCGWCVGRFAVPAAPGPRLVMGGFAFALLMAMEAALAILLFDRGPEAYAASFATAAGAIGLAGQLGFAVIPLVRRRQGG